MTPFTRPARRLLPGAGLCLLALLTGCGGAATTPTSAPTPVAGSPASTPPATGGGPASSGASASQAPVPVESNPPGDIPDSLAFVGYRNSAGGYSFTYPEGWARTEHGAAVTFTDKLNGIQADTAGVPSTLTPDAVRAQEVPRLTSTQPAFELMTVEPVALPAGTGVHLVYRRNSAPDPVTGRQVRDEVQSYLVASGASHVRLDLFGPVGADNVDAYRTISQSLRLA